MRSPGPHFSPDARTRGARIALSMLRHKPRTLRSMEQTSERAGELGSELAREDLEAARVTLLRWGERAGATIDPYGEWL